MQNQKVVKSMEDTAVVCKCRGCGMECCLTAKELALYSQSSENNNLLTYPKCGRPATGETQVLCFFD